MHCAAAKMTSLALLAGVRRGTQALLSQATPALAACAPCLLSPGDSSALANRRRCLSTGSALLHAEPARADVLHDVLSTQLEDIHKAGTYKQERIIVTPQGTSVGRSWAEMGPTCLHTVEYLVS